MLLPPFLLILFRIGGLTFAAPIFSSSGVPARVKMAFSFVLALMIAPAVFPTIPTQLELGEVVSAVFGELLIGLILGTAVGLIFLGARLTGMIIGQQAGIGLGQVFNPMLNSQSTIVGQLYFFAFMLVFFAIGGHLEMMRALLDTFETIPPGSYQYSRSVLTLMETLLSSAFALAIRLAGPALIALFMASISMGFLSRTIPQLNILSIGFAVRVFIGLSVAGLSLPLAYELIHGHIIESMIVIRAVFGLD